MPKGDENTVEQPPLNDEWQIFAEPKWNQEKAKFDAAEFSATNGGTLVTGTVTTGEASAQLSEGNAKLDLSYRDAGMDGKVSYLFGGQSASLLLGYSTNGGMSATAKVTVGSVTTVVSTGSVGVNHSFGNGWTGSLSHNFGSSGLTLTFSNPSTSFGNFSMSVGASLSGGTWSVDAKFKLVYTNSQ